MKKSTLLNSEISYEIAKLGHTDGICIADAGLPIPDECRRIDLALCNGTPSFIDTLKTIMSEMQVEAVNLADEIDDHNPELKNQILELLKKAERESGKEIPVSYCSHTQFKLTVKNCKAVIRTGECTPYANIILKSGVVF